MFVQRSPHPTAQQTKKQKTQKFLFLFSIVPLFCNRPPYETQPRMRKQKELLGYDVPFISHIDNCNTNRGLSSTLHANEVSLHEVCKYLYYELTFFGVQEPRAAYTPKLCTLSHWANTYQLLPLSPITKPR